MNGREPGPEETVIFLHIPKTGGRTLANMLRRQYGRDRVYEAYGVPNTVSINAYMELPAEEKARYRAITGHVGIDMHRSVPGPSVYLTLLREPLRRAVSTYHYVRRRPGHPSHEALTAPGMTLERALEAGLVEMFDNGQTRALAGTEAPYGACGGSMLEAALETIRNMRVVGLTERFDETLVRMKTMFGWRDCFYAARNVAPRREPIVQLPPSTLALLRELNQLDLELYEHVRRSLDDWAVRHPGFRARVKFFTVANAFNNRGRGVVRRLQGRESTPA